MGKSVGPIVWVVASEVAATALFTALARTSGNFDTLSVLTGCLLFLVPSIYFTMYAFRYTSVQFTSFTVQLFYRGQMGKLVLTALGFALVFKFYSQRNPVALFAAYGLMLTVHVFVAHFLSSQFSQNQTYQNN